MGREIEGKYRASGTEGFETKLTCEVEIPKGITKFNKIVSVN
jgi:hypothetical protein